MLTSRLAAAASAAAALTLFAAPSALASGTPHTATFKMTVHGSEATTWSYDRPGFAATCTPGEHGNGSQMIRFETHSTRLVHVKRDLETGGGPIFSTDNWRMGALADRDGDMRTDVPIFDGRKCIGLKPAPVYKYPCGSTYPGRIELKLEWVGDEANHLQLSGVEPNFGGTGLSQAFGPECPLLVNNITEPEVEGGLIEAQHFVRENALFNPKRKVFKIFASRVEDNPPLGFVGSRTVVAYNVVLKRVKK